MSTADPRREYVRNAIVDALGIPSDKVWLTRYQRKKLLARHVPSFDSSACACERVGRHAGMAATRNVSI